jgi:hypothetical protein
VTEQVLTLFYSRTTHDWIRHSFLYSHVKDSPSAVENDPKCDGLWKPRCIFDVLNDASSKYYSLSKTLTIEEVIHTVF